MADQPAAPGSAATGAAQGAALPSVSLIIAAHDEEEVIAAKVANALALDYPRRLLEVIVASDGSSDATVERARGPAPISSSTCRAAARSRPRTPPPSAPRGRRSPSRTPTASGRRGRSARWSPPLAPDGVGYACGQVRFTGDGGENLEGAYWRYEMAVRHLESGLGGITAGNGGIYAVRRDAYIPLRPSGSHDLSFPFGLAKRGLRSVYAPGGAGPRRRWSPPWRASCAASGG